MVKLASDDVVLREFGTHDKRHLAELANNKLIWDNVRDNFPFPYSIGDAEEFIKNCASENPQVTFAIEYKGLLAGVVGLVLQPDVYRLSAELGYWVGQPFWNHGIATTAVGLVTDYGFKKLELIRIFSGVFIFNTASQRVLEKAGYQRECLLKNAVIKNGILTDELRYSRIRKRKV